MNYNITTDNNPRLQNINKPKVDQPALRNVLGYHTCGKLTHTFSSYTYTVARFLSLSFHSILLRLPAANSLCFWLGSLFDTKLFLLLFSHTISKLSKQSMFTTFVMIFFKSSLLFQMPFTLFFLPRHYYI